MKYVNGASHYLKEGFTVCSFPDYVKQRLKALEASITVPPYALEGEAERLAKLTEHIRSDPYKWFETCSDSAARYIEELKAESISRTSDPLLYSCVEDACDALCVEKPSAFSYAGEGGMRYNALAMGYMDMTWIFISRHFRENGILSDAELCFILGHELGHNAACHVSVELTQDVPLDAQRRHEMTADRAGLLAAIWRIAKTYPSLSSEEVVSKALDASQSVMRKLDLLPVLVRKKKPVTPENIQILMDNKPLKETHADSESTHPTAWERVTAMRQFASSIPFLRCISTLWGKDHPIVTKYSGSGLFDSNLSESVKK